MRERRESKTGRLPARRVIEIQPAPTIARANDLMWQYVVNNYLKGKAPPAFDLLYWNADSTNLPGPMFCWYVRKTYLENNLRQPGKTVQCGEEVDLSLIDIPTFLYASRDDHIVPWRTAYQSAQILAGDNTFVLGASGHIAGVINPPARKKRNFWVAGEPSPDPERWLETAAERPRKLVARMERMAGAAGGGQGAGPRQARQPPLSRDRAGSRTLCQSQGGVTVPRFVCLLP
jgi:polyhydroxyalkanoate synthase